MWALGSNTSLNMRKVATVASDDTDVLCLINKFNGDFIDSDGRDSFLVVYFKFLVSCRKCNQFCLFWGKSDMVGGTVIKGEPQDVVKEEDVIGDQDNIVSLSN